MKTERITGDIDRAARIIESGGLVAVPTETVYGLAANGMDGRAVERIYEVKGRPAAKPLSLMVPDPGALERYGRRVSRGARVLADAFWPGPLTIVVEADPAIPAIVLAGGGTVGLRCPASPPTLALLKKCALPLAGPSANPSGAPSPKTADQVTAYFDGAIDAILDGGPCGLGTESTIVDMTGGAWKILRQGALPREEIRRALADSLGIVGVTGGTGAGKTTALEVLAAQGALVIDADAVYHDLCRTSEPMLTQIEARFPGSVRDGVLQRKKLGSTVFSDPGALAELDAITQAYTLDAIEELLADHAAAGGRYAAVDAINIIGTPLRERLTALVGVLADEDTRVARLMAREGVSEQYARLRIRAQKPDGYYIENCDHILRNDGSRGDFRRACDKLFNTILEDQSDG